MTFIRNILQFTHEVYFHHVQVMKFSEADLPNKRKSNGPNPMLNHKAHNVFKDLDSTPEEVLGKSKNRGK